MYHRPLLNRLSLRDLGCLFPTSACYRIGGDFDDIFVCAARQFGAGVRPAPFGDGRLWNRVDADNGCLLRPVDCFVAAVASLNGDGGDGDGTGGGHSGGQLASSQLVGSGWLQQLRQLNGAKMRQHFPRPVVAGANDDNGARSVADSGAGNGLATGTVALGNVGRWLVGLNQCLRLLANGGGGGGACAVVAK